MTRAEASRRRIQEAMKRPAFRQQILAVDLDGHAEVMATVPTTMPFSIDWLPDGRLLVVARAPAAHAGHP